MLWAQSVGYTVLFLIVLSVGNLCAPDFLTEQSPTATQGLCTGKRAYSAAKELDLVETIISVIGQCS